MVLYYVSGSLILKLFGVYIKLYISSKIFLYISKKFVSISLCLVCFFF